jgi:hypothetical protein
LGGNLWRENVAGALNRYQTHNEKRGKCIKSEIEMGLIEKKARPIIQRMTE